MTAVALGLYLGYLLTAFGVRSLLQYRHTGSTGFRGVSGRPFGAGWWGGVLFVLALALGLSGPLLQLLGVVSAIAALDHGAVHGTGLALTTAGMVATLLAQHVMGRSWRVGVDPRESTDLVTTGAFAWVRNPVFTAMIATGAGLALLAGDPVTIAAFVILVVAVQIQVRAVEEPHLLRVHGSEYRDYAARVGRFLPGIGRHSG